MINKYSVLCVACRCLTCFNLALKPQILQACCADLKKSFVELFIATSDHFTKSLKSATNSDIDVNIVSSCILEKKQVKYSGKIIQLSRSASDKKVLYNRNNYRIKRKIKDNTLPPSLHSPAKKTSAESTYFESPCCLVESPSSGQSLVVSPETTAESQPALKEKSSSLIQKTTESRNMLVSGQSEISHTMDTLESVLAQNEFIFQDTVSLHDFATNVDILANFSSPIKTEFTDEFLEIFASDDLPTNNALFSSVAMSDVNDSHLSCNSISALLQQSSVFTNGDHDIETYSHDIADVKISHSDICMESSFINLPCDQSSLEHVSSDSQLWDFFSGSEHSYCSRLLPGIEFASDTSGKSCFAAFRDSQENANAYYDQELSQCISDILDYSCSISNSTNADAFFIEEQEVVIDASGNDIYCHPPSQFPDCERWDENSISIEAIVKTEEKDTKTKDTETLLNNSLDHTEFSADPLSEDTDVYFDKIPSYYTALSISSKPLTTTVFASSTKNIGSTDHMDMWGSSVRFDGRQYDKVPSHRRCFTNTVKEVEIKPGNLDNNIVATGHEPEEDSLQNSPTHESVIIPLTVENVAAADVKHSRTSHSPCSKAPERCSRSPVRRSPSTSRFSRHSASSSSACSTCSSCSRCSTCSGSRSGSSSGSERSSSLCSEYRNRSGSPVSRINKYSADTTRYSFTPQEHQQSKSKAHSSSEELVWRSQRHKHKTKHNSPMKSEMLPKSKFKEEAQMKAMEERRIVYVGKIPNGYTKKQLYQRFQRFGEIKDVKVNFREHGDNYGFVTFAYSCDAVAAKEKGNSIPGEARFDLCFGGRRHFCPDQYADLDGNREIEEEYAPMPGNTSGELDFAALLKQHSSQQKKK